MKSNSQDLNDARSARRRLIKGGFSVPAVLTVASGSAMARTSSGCLAREVAQNVKPVYIADPSVANGTYVRVAAYTFKPNGNKVRSWWITFADLQAVAGAAGVTISGNWITAGQALCVEGGDGPPPVNGVFTTGQIYSPTSSPVLPPLATAAADAQTPRYYAVLFNAAGDVTGVSFAGSAQPGGAVNHSCWTSFKPV